MAARLDGVQIAITRAVTDAQQQHAAQRQPVVAQEQAASTVRDATRAREQRPEAVPQTQRDGVRGDLVGRPEDRPGGGRRRRAGRPPAAAGESVAGQPAPPAGSPDGKGSRVDVRL